MVCTFCKSDNPKKHNIRTCSVLTVVIGLFNTKKAVEWSMDSFKEAVVGAVVADCAGGGGFATSVVTIYGFYEQVNSLVDAYKFNNASRKEQVEIIGKFFDGDDLDLLIGSI
jgi:hypothetical protein